MTNLITKLTNIGNAIRAKTGGTSALTLDAMPQVIASITSADQEYEDLKQI